MSESLAKRRLLRAIFRDIGFAGDAMKINIGEIFKRLSAATEFKTLLKIRR